MKLELRSPKPAGPGILGWFGSRQRPGADEPDGRPRPPVSIHQEARRQLLDAIASLLLDNDLEITPENLRTAYRAYSGQDHKLARLIADRLSAHEKITQPWLDQQTGEDGGRGELVFDHLVEKLEGDLDVFSKNTKSARVATSAYKVHLDRHVSELTDGHDPADIVLTLTNLTKAMAERTLSIEGEMRRSENEAKSLRKSLARARREADIDHLTGLPNRRAFEGLLEGAYAAALAAAEPLTVAFCDIDHFKKINDAHGHDAGDRVLKAVAEALAKVTNDCCHVARHGGEEFVLLFERLAPDAAKEKLDGVREKMSSRRLVNRHTEEPFGQVTFSGGVANVLDYPDPRTALKAADQALYKAKQAGRNLIVIASRG